LLFPSKTKSRKVGLDGEEDKRTNQNKQGNDRPFGGFGTLAIHVAEEDVQKEKFWLSREEIRPYILRAKKKFWVRIEWGAEATE